MRTALAARYHWLLLLMMVALGLSFTVFFGRQAYASLHRLLEGTQPIVRPWMTIPRVARQFNIPEAELYRSLNVQPQRPDPRPLDLLAREKGLMPHIFVAQVQQFVDDYHRPSPPPSSSLPSSFALFFWKQVLDVL